MTSNSVKGLSWAYPVHIPETQLKRKPTMKTLTRAILATLMWFCLAIPLQAQGNGSIIHYL